MINIERVLNAAAKEYMRKNNDKKMGIGDSFATAFDDGVLILGNTADGLDVDIILGEPYRVNCPYDVKTAEEAALAELEKEFGDRTLENGDDFATLFNDAVLIIGMENGIKKTEVIKGKALEIDMAIVEED